MKLNRITLQHLWLTLIGLPLLFTFVQAAHHKADPIGKWKIEISGGGQTYYPEATFTKVDGELKGSYYSQLSGETFDLEDPRDITTGNSDSLCKIRAINNEASSTGPGYGNFDDACQGNCLSGEEVLIEKDSVVRARIVCCFNCLAQGANA